MCFLGGITFREATDADSINVTGVYRSNNDLQNVPSGWGSLLHIETEYAIQLFIVGNSASTNFYVRQRLGTGTWKSWNQVTITAI